MVIKYQFVDAFHPLVRRVLLLSEDVLLLVFVRKDELPVVQQLATRARRQVDLCLIYVPLLPSYYSAAGSRISSKGCLLKSPAACSAAKTAEKSGSHVLCPRCPSLSLGLPCISRSTFPASPLAAIPSLSPLARPPS